MKKKEYFESTVILEEEIKTMASHNEGCVSYQEKSRIYLREFSKKMRLTRKMKKKDIANKYGIHPDTFRSWMRDGHCGGPSLGKHGLLIVDAVFSCPFGLDAPSNIFEPSVHELLKDFRKEKKLTLNSLSMQAGVDVNTVFRWEHGLGSPTLNKHMPLVLDFLEWLIQKDISTRISVKGAKQIKTLQESK